MRRSILIASLIAGLCVFFFIGSAHAGELDSLNSVVKQKTAELFSDSLYGNEISKMPRDSVTHFLDYLLAHHLRDTMSVYTMAMKVKEIAHAQHTILGLMAQRGMIDQQVALQGKWRQERVIAMIEGWFFNENSHDEPTVVPVRHALNLD